MAKGSVPQSEHGGRAGQLQRPWQRLFRQRMRDVPPALWRCIGVDIGKYEHVAVAQDGLGELLAPSLRFHIRQADLDRFFAYVTDLCTNPPSLPLIAMEPTGHYYENLAYQASQQYGAAQVYLVQSTDVARQRRFWNQGTYKDDEVDACIINELLRNGHARPYWPSTGVYQDLYQLERYRWAREQASTRLKNQIVGHVDRLFPGLVIGHGPTAAKYQPLWRNLWERETPRRLLMLCPDPSQLRQHSAQSLYQLFRSAGYWMTRPYAAKIVAAVKALCRPEPQMAAWRSTFLQRDLSHLTELERQIGQVEAEMVSRLDQTWACWLAPTGVDPVRLACLAATVGEIGQYASARQLFGRSGLHAGRQDSGTQQRRGRGERIVKPGDRHLRRQLMRFTLCMLARYPGSRRYKSQLCQRGKLPITANIAVARKLTGIIYAVATQEVPFDPSHLA